MRQSQQCVCQVALPALPRLRENAHARTHAEIAQCWALSPDRDSYYRSGNSRAGAARGSRAVLQTAVSKQMHSSAFLIARQPRAFSGL